MRDRFRLCRYCGDLHSLRAWPHNCMPDPPARSDYPAPYIISDTLPGGVNGLFHHAALKKIDSKSAYRRATRDAGCIEIGNEQLRPVEDRPLNQRALEHAINEAINEVAFSDGDTSDIAVVPDYNMGKGVHPHG
jgi:hypothetical protein